MSATRILVAGVLGGVAMFIWGAVSHMALPLGGMGVSSLPDSVVPAMADAKMDERRIYFFPGLSDNASEAEQKAWSERYAAGPRGVVVYDPQAGVRAMSGSMFGAELLSSILACVILACVLSRLECCGRDKVVLATLLGVFAWLSVHVSYWSWYRFPDSYTFAALLEQGIGALVAGAVITLALGRKEPTVDELLDRIRAERAGA